MPVWYWKQYQTRNFKIFRFPPQKRGCNFFPQQLRFDNIHHWKADKISYKMMYLVNLYNFFSRFEPIYTGLVALNCLFWISNLSSWYIVYTKVGKMQNFLVWIKFLIASLVGSLRNFDKLLFSGHLFIFFLSRLFWDISCQKTPRMGWVGTVINDEVAPNWGPCLNALVPCWRPSTNIPSSI